jgi:myo-inositol 2-dehydrogenase / D-chiro-inositol 1-dehydrogenase
MKLRVGMLGTIDHINSFAPFAQERNDIDFVGIADSDPVIGKKLSEKYKTQYFKSIDELLSEKLDAVGVFTQFNNRSNDIIKCLNLGLHVFTDKPAAIDMTGLKLLEETLDSHPKLKFTMALILRVKPENKKIQQYIREGSIGKVVTVCSRRSYALKRGTRPEFMFDSALSGGEWVELAVHGIDLVRWLTGKEYITVVANHGNVTSPTEPYQDHGSAMFELEDGVTAFIQHNRLNPVTSGGLLTQHLSIVGSEGVVDLGDDLRLWNNLEPAHKVDDLPERTALFDNFIDAICFDTPLVVPSKDVLRVTEIALAAYESSNKSGEKIKLV